MVKKTLKAFRGSILHFLSDPGDGSNRDAVEYFDDGLLLIEDEHIVKAGPAADLLPGLPADTEIFDYTGKLIMPGMIDAHVHYPQTDIIASHGGQLLEWLNRYTFDAERRFGDPGHAQEVAEFFLEELLRNGTTSALIFATIHPESVDAICEAARKRNMRLIAGKVLMDRHCPEYLQDTPDSAYRDSKALIERWHGQDRLQYAITPRFAPTSSNEQLEQAGKLAQEHPDVLVHTHVAENKEEVAWVAKLFPWSRSYLDVYDRYGLLRDRAVYAHCIHLDDEDRQRMAESGAAMAFCPTSNLFLGSGLFDLAAARSHRVRVGLATDVGGGTSFSMLRTMSEAYKVLQLAGQTLSAHEAFYLATLGSAQALCIDDCLGNFLPGKEADFVVLDFQATPMLERRLRDVRNPHEKLFALMTLGDDRSVAATYVMGQPVYGVPPASDS